MGIWRSHHSIGNIAGSLIAGAFVEYSWGLSFAVPAVIIFSLGLLLFVFLVPDPRAVGCPVPNHSAEPVRGFLFLKFLFLPESFIIWTSLKKLSPPKIVIQEAGGDSSSLDSTSIKSDGQSDKSIHKNSDADDDKAISFWRAVRIPVSLFSPFVQARSDGMTMNKHVSFAQGVIEYSFSLFFTKLINYTFLYWLPKYLKDSSIYTCCSLCLM